MTDAERALLGWPRCTECGGWLERKDVYGPDDAVCVNGACRVRWSEFVFWTWPDALAGIDG